MLYDASVKSYISETAHPKIRGSLVTMPAFSMAIGLLVTWILGNVINAMQFHTNDCEIVHKFKSNFTYLYIYGIP